MAARRPAVRGAGRRQARGPARPRRRQARPARPGDLRADRPRPAVHRVRAGAVGRRHVDRRRRRRARRVAMSVVDVDTATAEVHRAARRARRPARRAYLPSRGRSSSRARSAGSCTRWSTRRPTRSDRPGGRAAAVRRVGARRPDRPVDRAAGPGEGLLHQPRHRRHRRELRRLDRLRPRCTGSGCAAQWGVVDVERREVGRAVAGRGRAGADRARLAIRGGSAGGWTALAAVTTGAVAARCSARRSPTSASRTCAASPRHARLRVALPGRPDRAAARVRDRRTPSGRRSGT